MKTVLAAIVAATAITVATARPKDAVVEKAVDTIAAFEGFREKAYVCPAGKKTIGYGFTSSKYTSRGAMSRAEAREILRVIVTSDLTWIETVSPRLSDSQKVAVASFVYNLGRSAYLNSTFKKRLDAGRIEEARSELMRWVHAGGKVLKGLVRRRAVEAALL